LACTWKDKHFLEENGNRTVAERMKVQPFFIFPGGGGNLATVVKLRSSNSRKDCILMNVLSEVLEEEGLTDGMEGVEDAGNDQDDHDQEQPSAMVVEEFVDISEARSASHVAGTGSAINKFNQFLVLSGKTGSQADLTKTDGTRLLTMKKELGQFGSYMLNRTKLAHGTALGYLNKIRNYILTKTEDKSDVSGSKWYSRLTNNLTRMYERKVADAGGRLSNQAEPMLAPDLENFCTVLVELDRLDTIAQRCMLILQWQTFGRVSEVSGLHCGAVSWAADVDSAQIYIDLHPV
jgi:hypothetical protein